MRLTDGLGSPDVSPICFGEETTEHKSKSCQFTGQSIFLYPYIWWKLWAVIERMQLCMQEMNLLWRVAGLSLRGRVRSLVIWEFHCSSTLNSHLRWFSHLPLIPPGCLLGGVFRACPTGRRRWVRPRRIRDGNQELDFYNTPIPIDSAYWFQLYLHLADFSLCARREKYWWSLCRWSNGKVQTTSRTKTSNLCCNFSSLRAPAKTPY